MTRLSTAAAALALVVVGVGAVGSPPVQGSRDDCLAFVCANLAKGNGNWYTYNRFSTLKVDIKVGDVLIYDVFLDPKNPVAKGGIDIDFTGSTDPLRDMGLTDQNGLRAHGDAVLEPAVGKWYTRLIPLDKAAGQSTVSWNVDFEGDQAGKYAQFIDNVLVKHADGTTTSVYSSGGAAAKDYTNVSGYSNYASLVSVDRVRVTGDLGKLIEEIDQKAERLRSIEQARQDVEFAKKFAERNPGSHLEGHIMEANALLDKVEKSDNPTPQDIQAALHAASQALAHTHPVMEKYTGHLVGHAHIDLQWLWEWQEGIVFSRDTFNQAVKFMDEFPGFTFSQSSSCLYETTQEHYPELFAKMKERIKSGQWEVVGGRVCEGDTNMISPESQARQFLYGQSYFREQFGKTAVVGWEPDTFGHSIQMPQILKLGGCKYYYFCRGGKDKPLFWWQGLDGTKILAFDEPASGSWYNSDLSYHQFQEMIDFQDKTGSKDMLWVYGVGNHGGGPTREHIETALQWMKDPTKPKVQFSTATQFFKKLETYDLAKIPVVDQELNPVFDGCYTSHSEIKQLNRQSEYATMAAEAVATVASLNGFPYPHAAFRKNWEDICFNHHHDTLPGSGVHAPYERTKIVLGRVLADDKDIATRALESLSVQVTPEPGGVNVLVFNPSGWKRGGWINSYLVQSGWYGEGQIDFSKPIVASIGKSEYPVNVTDKVSHLARFYAGDVPAFGYRVFHIRNGEQTVASPSISQDSSTVETDRLIVSFDKYNGCISHIYDKKAKKEVVAAGGGMGRLEIHYEQPNGMSAWVLGKIDKIAPFPASSTVVKKNGTGVDVSFHYHMESAQNPDHETTVTQTFHIEQGSDTVAVDVDCDWEHIGTDHTLSPLLRVAFDTSLTKPISTYEIPFGALARPVDNTESAALNWGDLGEAGYGVSILNDSKHGYSAQGSTMRLSLIRSSYSPDPNPNPGLHHWRYAIVPHSGDWKSAGTVQRAMEFNEPLMSATVPFDAKGANPLEWSLGSISDSTVVATGLKLAEKSKDLVLRMYQTTGIPVSGAIKLEKPVLGSRWVNFLEDDLGAASALGSSVPFKLHPYEIRTVKIKLGD